MKRSLFFLFGLVVFSFYSVGQIDSAIYGVSRDASTQELYLSKINPLTGVVTNISTSSFSSWYELESISTIDPINKIFYLNSNDTLFGVNLSSGSVQYCNKIVTPITGYFDQMNFNYNDTTLYGITRDAGTQELYLSKIDPLTGVVTNISNSPFSSWYILNSKSTIDPINNIFYIHSNDTLFGINLLTGNTVSKCEIITPITGYFDQMNFNCNDTTVYGITRDASTQELYLSRISSTTGVVSNISAAPFSSWYILNSLSTINPISDLYYIHSNDTLFVIDLNTGDVISKNRISMPITGYFDLMVYFPNLQNTNSSVNEEFIDISIIVFPNPSYSTVSVKSSLHLIEQIELFDSNGRLIYKSEKLNNRSSQIDLSIFYKGLILCLITDSSGKRHFYKIIHQ